MTYEELLSIEQSIDERMEALRLEWKENKDRYIREHAPLELVNGDEITIKLQVTEESRAHVMKKYLNLPRYQLGHIYYKRGVFYDWEIDNKTGDVKPDLKFGIWYDSLDKIVSIKKTRGK